MEHFALDNLQGINQKGNVIKRTLGVLIFANFAKNNSWKLVPQR